MTVDRNSDPDGGSTSAASTFPCRAPWDGALVHWSGAVYPCGLVCHRACGGSLRLGHLDEQPLEAILNGERAQTLRRRLLAGDLHGLCCLHCDKAHSCNPYGDPVAARQTAEGDAVLPWTATEVLDAAPHPTTRLELALTDLCNMRCTMCSLTAGDHSPDGLPFRGVMSLEHVHACLDTARTATARGDLVSLTLHWIGEPLVHPRFSEVLALIAEAGESVHLNLVTNGVALDASITERLLELPGEHTLSVSLNALTAATFRHVNGSTRRDRVYRQVQGFLDARAQRGLEDRFTVLVTSVVVRENLDELPGFVAEWQSRFEQRGGPAGVFLNGKGRFMRNAVVLLTEISRPGSQAVFRAALRKLAIEDAEWPLQPWEGCDAWCLAAPDDARRPALLDAALLDIEAGRIDPPGDAALQLLDMLARGDLPAPIREREACAVIARSAGSLAAPDPSRGVRLADSLGRLLVVHGIRLDAPAARALGTLLEQAPCHTDLDALRFLLARSDLDLPAPLHDLPALPELDRPELVQSLALWLYRRLPQSLTLDLRGATIARTPDLCHLLVAAADRDASRAATAIDAALAHLAAKVRNGPAWPVLSLCRRLLTSGLRPELPLELASPARDVPWDLRVAWGLLALLLARPEALSDVLEGLAADLNSAGPAAAEPRSDLARVLAARGEDVERHAASPAVRALLLVQALGDPVGAFPALRLPGTRPALLEQVAVKPGSRVLVLAPHPDDFDEVAVTLAALANRGCRLHLAVVTTGASGVTDGFGGATDAASKARLREQEQRESCRRFGLADTAIEFLDLPLGGDADDEDACRSSFEQCLRDTRPEIVVMPHWNDTNRGHRRTYRVFASLTGALGLSLAVLLDRDPKTIEMDANLYTPFDEERAAWKAELLRCHRSQQQRNLDTRGRGFDERILELNRQIAAELPAGTATHAECFEVEVWQDGKKR